MAWHSTPSKVLRSLLLAFIVALLATGAQAQAAKTSYPQIDRLLQAAVEQKHLPGVVAMVARGDRIVYQGAFGKAKDATPQPMALDSIFRIASMSKTVTSVAVMQLVERGKVKLDEPAATYLPELARVQVLEGFDADGKARFRPPKTPITVRQLLSHTSGFGYEFFNEKLAQYVKSGAMPSAMSGGDAWLNAPLLFDPGTAWEYGISIDWLGKLVEKVSGLSLEDYFRQNIFAPLGMNDSFFNVPADKQARVVTVYLRQPGGTLAEQPQQDLKPVTFYSGGGGLHSTAPDYLKFTRMLLGGGKLGNARILQAQTVTMMERNQIGDLNIRAFRSLIPQFARDGAVLPGGLDKFGFGFAVSTHGVEGERGPGSVAWAGIYNTFYWVDPARKTTAVLMTQMLPFMDDVPKALLEDFEKAVYSK